MGYHPGLEDDEIYLSAVQADLNPSLYPHDAEFFRLQVQATLFDEFMAGFVRVSHIPVAWSELLWQFVSLYSILWAAHRITQKLFSERCAQWAGVAMLAAMFTLPVAGTALNIADQHLHPRTMATALILMAVDQVLARKISHAGLLLLLALVFHPIMAACGISFCLWLALVLRDSIYGRLTSGIEPRAVMAALLPGWIFEPPSPAWRRALGTRTYYFLYRWTWYEWLGAIGPLVLFSILWFWVGGAKRNSPGTEALLQRFAFAVVLYGVFQQTLAMIVLATPGLIRVTPFQPMRYLHLVYVFVILIGGCLLGKYVLKQGIWRWAVVLLPAGGGMFVAQRVMFPASEHLEFPERASGNSWLQAFAWIRQNTPVDAYFAIGPDYMASPGEDFHGFRALAERSQLADATKDAAVVTQVPELAPRWRDEVDSQSGWSGFGIADFERLKDRLGVDWVLVSYPAPARLKCQWHNDRLAVCRIPGAPPGLKIETSTPRKRTSLEVPGVLTRGKVIDLAQIMVGFTFKYRHTHIYDNQDPIVPRVKSQNDQ